MNDLILSNGGELTTTSKIVADVFGRAHRDVLKAINNLDCGEEFSTRNYSQSEYTTERGKTYKCFNITEDGFYFLCMGFTGQKAAEWKIAFLDEFKRLRGSEINADKRINSISKELDQIKDDGRKWSELGRQINKSKKVAIAESKKLLDEVQLKLIY